MKITLSKTQWQEMGKKAGWIKQAQSTEEIEIMSPVNELEEEEALKQEMRNFINETRNETRRLKRRMQNAKNGKNPFERGLPEWHLWNMMEKGETSLGNLIHC